MHVLHSRQDHDAVGESTLHQEVKSVPETQDTATDSNTQTITFQKYLTSYCNFLSGVISYFSDGNQQCVGPTLPDFPPLSGALSPLVLTEHRSIFPEPKDLIERPESMSERQ